MIGRQFLGTRADREPSLGQRDALRVQQGLLYIAGSPFRFDGNAPEPEQERLDLLLTIAFRRRLAPLHVGQIAKALRVSANGDDALANLYIALAGSFRLAVAPHLGKQLLLADLLLAERTDRRSPLADFGLAATEHSALTKYDPDQPRVPPGSGATSGRWTASSAEGSAIVTPAAAALAAGADSLFLPEMSAATLSALSAFAASIGFAAVLGTLFVPSSNSVSSAGALPGPSGATYNYDHDEGALRIFSTTGVLLAACSRDKEGVFTDARTGLPFAREVDGALVFDGDAVREAGDAEAAPGRSRDRTPRKSSRSSAPTRAPTRKGRRLPSRGRGSIKNRSAG